MSKGEKRSKILSELLIYLGLAIIIISLLMIIFSEKFSFDKELLVISSGAIIFAFGIFLYIFNVLSLSRKNEVANELVKLSEKFDSIPIMLKNNSFDKIDVFADDLAKILDSNRKMLAKIFNKGNFLNDEMLKKSNEENIRNNKIMEDLIDEIQHAFDDIYRISVNMTSEKKSIYIKIMKILSKRLSGAGFYILLPEVGDIFDPVTSSVADEVKGETEGVVVEVITPGYRFMDNVLKPASVVVSKKD